MADRLAITKKPDRLAIKDVPVINPKALIAFELLNDPNRMVEGFMPEPEASIISEGFAMSDNPKADRLRLAENMMIAASTGTDLRSASDAHDDIKKVGFLETLKEEWTDPVRVGNKIPITGALFGIYEMVDVMKAVRRLGDEDFDYSKPFIQKPSFGQEMGLLAGFQTPAQKQPIYFTKEGDTKIVEDYIERVTKDRTFGGKVAAGISILPTWMVEFAMTGGLAGLGKESTKNAMVKMLGKYSKTKIGNAAMRTAGWTGGAVTRATLGLSPRIVEKAAERQAQARIGLREQEGWASSFAKAWGDVIIEAASEEAGVAITGAGAAVLRRVPLGSKIVDGLQKAWTSITGGAKGEFARRLLAKGGYSNILGEIGEERLGTILRAITDVEDFGAGPEAGMLQRLAAGLKQDIENLGVEAVVLAVPLAGQSIISRFGKDADRPLITEPAEKRPAEEVPKAAEAARIAEPPPEGIKVPAKAELEALPYKELQQQAKTLGIKANQKKEALIEQIIEARPAEAVERRDFTDEEKAAIVLQAKIRLQVIESEGRGIPKNKEFDVPAQPARLLTVDEIAERNFLRENADNPDAIIEAYNIEKPHFEQALDVFSTQEVLKQFGKRRAKEQARPAEAVGEDLSGRIDKAFRENDIEAMQAIVDGFGAGERTGRIQLTAIEALQAMKAKAQGLSIDDIINEKIRVINEAVPGAQVTEGEVFKDFEWLCAEWTCQSDAFALEEIVVDASKSAPKTLAEWKIALNKALDKVEIRTNLLLRKEFKSMVNRKRFATDVKATAESLKLVPAEVAEKPEAVTKKPPRNIAEARDRVATEWAQALADSMEPGQERYVPPQVNRLFTFRGKEKATLIPTSQHLRNAGLEPGTELNRWRKPAEAAEEELIPRPGETKDEFRARVRKVKGIKVRPAPKLPPPLPTKAEKAVIDAKKFLKQIKEHQAAAKGEGGRIDTEEVDDITEPFGRTMTPEWYEANSKRYKKTLLRKGTDLAAGVVEGIAKVFGVTSTRINNIAPEIFRRLRRHEFNVMTRTTEQTKRVEPFIRATTRRKLGKDFNAFEQAAKNSEGKIMLELAQKHGFTKELAELRKVLDELFHAGNAVGLEIDYRKEYMPRRVKDTKGFLEFFQKGDDWSIIRTVIENKESQRGRALTQTERAAVVNTLLRGYRTGALALARPGAAKERTVQEVTPEIAQFYHSTRESIRNYIEVMNEKIAAREFFGRQSKEITNLRARQSTLRTRLAKLATRQGRQKPADVDKDIRLGFFTGTLTEHISRAKQQFDEVTEKLDSMGADDLSNTIGQYVLELVNSEQIKPSQEKELRDLLMGRFDPKAAGDIVGGIIIPLTYIDVLSQITNSLTQLEELALAFYRSPVGFIPAATKAALNLSEITLEDIGVTTVAQELTDADARKILSTLLSITQFKRFDAFAKQTFVNTALIQLQQQSKKEGRRFNERLERVFGEETDQVVKDLKSGEITEDVKFLISNQLLDIQPIARSEMPEAYNRAGNLRIFYQLKTFMIKQFDFVRTEALQDMRNPVADPSRFMWGFSRLMWLTFSLALFGAGRDLLVDFITGRPFDLSDSVVDTILRRLFFSKFQFNKALREGLGRAVLEGFVPPTKTIDAITKDIKKVSRDDTDGLDVWRSVPIVGELYYWWFGRGREKALREEARARREQVRRKPLSTKRAPLKTKRKRLKTRRKPL